VRFDRGTGAAPSAFGAGLGAERAVGFVFRLLLVLALFALVRRFGELPALAGGVVGDLVASGRDRRLPLTLGSESGRLFVALLAALALLALATIVANRLRPILGSLLVLALFQALYGLWRADPKHLVLAAVVPLAVAPAAAALVVRRRHVAAALGTAAAILLVFASVHYVRGGVSRNAKLVVGRAPVHVVSYGGRAFRLESAADARDLQRAIQARTARRRPASAAAHDPQDPHQHDDRAADEREVDPVDDHDVVDDRRADRRRRQHRAHQEEEPAGSGQDQEQAGVRRARPVRRERGRGCQHTP